MIRLVAFDAYGTLLDVNAATGRLRPRMGGKADAVSSDWRRKQLEYTWLRSLMNRHVDFRQVTTDALDWALAANGLSDADLSAELLSLYDRLDPYPDAVPAVRAVRSLGLRTCVLSNGSPGMLDSGLGGAGLLEHLDAVLSVEQVGIYKPHPEAYRIACDRFAALPEEIVFVSANGWDAAGAAAYGFRVAWLNRAGAPPERLAEAPEVALSGLDQLVPWLKDIDPALSPTG